MRGVASHGMLAVLSAVASLPALGAEGRTPIFQPTVISGAGGRFVVTQNISAGGSAPIIDITATNVDLDLNGFELRHLATNVPVIRTVNPGTSIRHGQIRGGARGIEFTNATDTVIEDVAILDPSGDGIHIEDGANHVIRRVSISQFGGRGIHLKNLGNSRVEDTTIHGPGIGAGDAAKDGILLELVTSTRIERCIIQDMPGDGIELITTSFDTARSNQLIANILFNVGFDGIGLGVIGALISDNTVENAGVGIHLRGTYGQEFATVRRNVVRYSPTGIRVEGTGSWIDDNNVSRNTNGIHLTGTSSVNSYRGNNLINNQTAMTCTGGSVVYGADFCDQGTQNISFGTNLHGPPAAGSGPPYLF